MALRQAVAERGHVTLQQRDNVLNVRRGVHRHCLRLATGGIISTLVILVFTGAVVLGWPWLSAMQLQLTKEVAS